MAVEVSGLEVHETENAVTGLEFFLHSGVLLLPIQSTLGCRSYPSLELAEPGSSSRSICDEKRLGSPGSEFLGDTHRQRDRQSNSREVEINRFADKALAGSRRGKPTHFFLGSAPRCVVGPG